MTAGDHNPHLREFWARLQTGVSVAVAGTHSEVLLGVRDGMVRYFHEHLGRSVTAAVVPQAVEEDPHGLPISDTEAFALARRRVETLVRRVGAEYHFCVGTEGTLDSVEVDGDIHWFVHNWTVVHSPLGEAWGGSGSVQLPSRLVSGLAGDQVPFAVPGTRRGGGMMASITGGVETRRRATATATTHALASLFYGTLEGRPGHRR